MLKSELLLSVTYPLHLYKQATPSKLLHTKTQTAMQKSLALSFADAEYVNSSLVFSNAVLGSSMAHL
jgi:hypothetical protein